MGSLGKPAGRGCKGDLAGGLTAGSFPALSQLPRYDPAAIGRDIKKAYLQHWTAFLPSVKGPALTRLLTVGTLKKEAGKLGWQTVICNLKKRSCVLLRSMSFKGEACCTTKCVLERCLVTAGSCPALSQLPRYDPAAIGRDIKDA